MPSTITDEKLPAKQEKDPQLDMTLDELRKIYPNSSLVAGKLGEKDVQVVVIDKNQLLANQLGQLIYFDKALKVDIGKLIHLNFGNLPVTMGPMRCI
jgi:hypothetical protein